MTTTGVEWELGEGIARSYDEVLVRAELERTVRQLRRDRRAQRQEQRQELRRARKERLVGHGPFGALR